MPDVTKFLSQAGWGEADITEITPDASTRRYLRLTQADGSKAVLMIVTEAECPSIGRFRRVSSWLTEIGLSTPQEIAFVSGEPFLLLEDFGETLFAGQIERSPETSRRLYGVATDILAHVSRRTALPELPCPSLDELALAAVEPMAWYPGADTDASPELARDLLNLLQTLDFPDRVFSFRDYHAENMIWLRGREGLRRAGLLDFQDAFAAPLGYDLASLLRDARRSVPENLREEMIQRFASETDVSFDPLDRDIAILSLQRNLRILFVFARLVYRDKKPKYASFIPHVWSMLLEDFERCGEGRAKEVLVRAVPPPENLP